MKIAISGKGGVGKSTLAAMLSLFFGERGKHVLAVDADPDSNLARALGIPRSVYDGIVPISRQRALIEQRTGARVREYGQMFKLNPVVADIADTYAHTTGNVSLLVMGGAERGGKGCACPENVLLRALLANIVLTREECVIIDMEAGIEHLGRGTSAAIDALVIVVEPARTSLETAARITKLAKEIDIRTTYVIGNKIASDKDKALIREDLPDGEILGYVPLDVQIKQAERENHAPYELLAPSTRTVVDEIFASLAERVHPNNNGRKNARSSGVKPLEAC